LLIRASDDPLEREADRIADRIAGAPGHSTSGGEPECIHDPPGRQRGLTGAVPPSVELALVSPSHPTTSPQYASILVLQQRGQLAISMPGLTQSGGALFLVRPPLGWRPRMDDGYSPMS
jgi:hypothetical protein